MDNREMLTVAKATLAGAISGAEFTQEPADLAFVKVLAQKVEDLKAKIQDRPAARVEEVFLVNQRVNIKVSLDNPLGFFK